MFFLLVATKWASWLCCKRLMRWIVVQMSRGPTCSSPRLLARKSGSEACQKSSQLSLLQLESAFCWGTKHIPLPPWKSVASASHLGCSQIKTFWHSAPEHFNVFREPSLNKQGTCFKGQWYISGKFSYTGKLLRLFLSILNPISWNPG